MNRNLAPDENTKIVKYILKNNVGQYKLNKKGKQLTRRRVARKHRGKLMQVR